MVALAIPDMPDLVEVKGDWLTVALPRSADECYDAFAQVDRTPEWLSIVRSAVVTERDLRGRPQRVAFLCRLRRATVGYTLTYSYWPGERRLAWTTPARSSIVVVGSALFQPLSAKSCLLTYSLDLAMGGGTPDFADQSFRVHATSATLADFRDFVGRARP